MPGPDLRHRPAFRAVPPGPLRRRAQGLAPAGNGRVRPAPRVGRVSQRSRPRFRGFRERQVEEDVLAHQVAPQPGRSAPARRSAGAA